jgi:hypothetical protein
VVAIAAVRGLNKTAIISDTDTDHVKTSSLQELYPNAHSENLNFNPLVIYVAKSSRSEIPSTYTVYSIR